MEEPYCANNNFGKWIVDKKANKISNIKLFNTRQPNKCELNDIDYGYETLIKQKKEQIEEKKIRFKQIDIDKIPEKPPELKQELLAFIKKTKDKIKELEEVVQIERNKELKDIDNRLHDKAQARLQKEQKLLKKEPKK